MPTNACPHCQSPIGNINARNCNRCGAPLDLGPGALVAGQYRVVQAIKRGGSGQIYLAEDTRTFNRHCVLKRTQLKGDAAMRQRFASEAQTVTKLRHPQIPQVYAFLDDGADTYIVMEYIAGRDLEQGLSQTLADGTFMAGRARPLDQVLHDGMTVCSILEHLHSRNPSVVHCDIKPANLIRDHESNSLFLVDFGAAAAVGAGENYGTPGYAPPELYRGERLPASDIYALGATLYHLLTDDDPCDHPLRFPKLAALPQVLREIIERTLSERPSQRPTASELRSQLERCMRLPAAKPTLRFPSGAVPQSTAEFVREARNDWRYTMDAMVEGDVERWLRDNGQLATALWLNQTRPTTSPDLAVQMLLRRLDPNLPEPEVRFGQQAVEMPATRQPTAVPLKVVARGGVARVKVVKAPMWLQVGPQDLVLRPDEPDVFNLGLDLDRISDFNQSGTLVLDAYVGGSAPKRYNMPVTIGQDSSGQRLKGTPKHPVHLTWLLLGWLAAFGAIAIALVAQPTGYGLIAHMAVGAAVALTMFWMIGENTTDAIIMIGGGAMAGIFGGTILRAFITGAAGSQIGVLAFVLAAALSMVGCLLYQWMKAY